MRLELLDVVIKPDKLTDMMVIYIYTRPSLLVMEIDKQGCILPASGTNGTMSM